MSSNAANVQKLIRKLRKLDQHDEELLESLSVNTGKRKEVHNEIRLLIELENVDSAEKRNMSSPDFITEFLTAKSGPAKPDEITRGIRALGCYVNEPTVRSTLVRHHNLGLRFVRVGKNLYDLIDKK